MKIICILNYYLEDYYKMESVFPLEYSSIQDLKDFFEKKKSEFEHYVSERNRISVIHSNVTSSDRYRALQTSFTIIQKALRIQRNNFSKDKKDSEWKKKLQELEFEEKRIKRDMESMTENLEKYPTHDHYFKIGDKTIMFFSEYEYEGTKKSLDFYTLEDWFEKNKNK